MKNPIARVASALFGTIFGLIALLSFKTHAPISSLASLPTASLPDSSSASSSSSAPSVGAPSSAPPHPAATRTILGQAIQTRYGIVQIKLDVAGKTIKNASFVQLTAFDQHSADINNYAAPILLQETIQAQNANIDMVSGATYTSLGYQQSLQSALDQAGI